MISANLVSKAERILFTPVQHSEHLFRSRHLQYSHVSFSRRIENANKINVTISFFILNYPPQYLRNLNLYRTRRNFNMIEEQKFVVAVLSTVCTLLFDSDINFNWISADASGTNSFYSSFARPVFERHLVFLVMSTAKRIKYFFTHYVNNQFFFFFLIL